jgi:hypothetical protein
MAARPIPLLWKKRKQQKSAPVSQIWFQKYKMFQKEHLRSLPIFSGFRHQSRISMRNCFACQDEFFANNPLEVKKYYQHAIDFALHVSPFLCFREFRLSVCSLRFLP